MRLKLTNEALSRLADLKADPGRACVGVLGLGIVGMGMALHLARRGANVVGADLREEIDDAGLWAAGVELRLGPMTASTFSDVDAVAISPGADPRQPAIQAVLAGGRPVFGELELVGELPARVAAITGTNGKSTTTALTGALVAAAGRSTFVGGNLGDPVVNWIERGAVEEFAVVELSSFQLETAYSLEVDVGVMLNVTPDHFERYPDVDTYAHTKQRLVECATVNVLNHDDPRVVAMAAAAKGSMLWFSTREDRVPGDGAVLAGDRVAGFGSAALLDGFELEHPRLFGRHNREDALAALLACHALGVLTPENLDAVRAGYLGFNGLEHRLEWVADKRGVVFINDSKATNDESAAVAVGAMERPVILLAGGRDKGTGYARLVEVLSSRVKKVIAYGEAGDLIAEALADVAAVARVDSMAQAFERAVAAAEDGDTVLLAPACSSFDEFVNYKERGHAFKRLVGELPA